MTGRGHSVEDKFPGLIEHCRAWALANYPDARFADHPKLQSLLPKLLSRLPKLREEIAQSSACTLAVVLEYKHAMKLAAEGVTPPDTDFEWEILAARCGMKGGNQRDRGAIVRAALAQARGAVGPQMSLNERLQADAEADPSLYALNSVELAARYNVTPAAIRQTRWWKTKRAARERAKQELREPRPQERRRPD
jgi:hypothetical protein